MLETLHGIVAGHLVYFTVKSDFMFDAPRWFTNGYFLARSNGFQFGNVSGCFSFVKNVCQSYFQG